MYGFLHYLGQPLASQNNEIIPFPKDHDSNLTLLVPILFLSQRQAIGNPDNQRVQS